MIGPSITIKGEITGDEDLTIQGTVEGTVDLAQYEVNVGQTGQVSADIRAKTVRIDGTVSGDVNGGENVVITKSGNVQGNIVAPRVTLEDGAIFKGSIDMDPGDTASSTVPLGGKTPANSASAADDIASFDLKSG